MLWKNLGKEEKKNPFNSKLYRFFRVIQFWQGVWPQTLHIYVLSLPDVKMKGPLPDSKAHSLMTSNRNASRLTLHVPGLHLQTTAYIFVRSQTTFFFSFLFLFIFILVGFFFTFIFFSFLSDPKAAYVFQFFFFFFWRPLVIMFLWVIMILSCSYVCLFVFSGKVSN